MNWSEYLHDEETIVWQGRPAPRCFTFRNWIHSLFGIVILIASVGWAIHGLHLGKEDGQAIFALIPAPFLLVGVYLTFGHLILARLEWEKVFYALTEKRILVTRGFFSQRLESLDLADVIYFQLRSLGAELGTVRVQCRQKEQKLTVSCIEYPRQLTDRLETAMKENGIDLQAADED